MRDAVPHLEDFLLVQKCLARDEAGIAALQQAHTGGVLSYLMKAGAQQAEAEEVLACLWADCLIGSPEAQPKLRRYDGLCSLRTWLNTVALNRVLTMKRHAERWSRVLGPSLDASAHTGTDEYSIASATAVMERPAHTNFDAPLLTLMRQAVEHAFSLCPSDHFVMLQLVHGNGLRRVEVAQMFGCDESTVGRIIDRASQQIAHDTLHFLREQDPWLDVQWEDFLELCGSAGFWDDL